MNNKGFTLVELLGVILLIAALYLLVAPSLIEEISKSKDKIDEATMQLIYTGADQYISSNQNSYPKVNGNTYCITLQQIVDNGNLSEPIKDVKTGTDIPLSKLIKTKVNNKKYSYELVDQGNCTAS